MKTTASSLSSNARWLSLTVGAAVMASILLPASRAAAQSDPNDFCTWYPGTPECRCQENPFDVVCSTVTTQPPPWETYRDEVPPPPTYNGLWLLPMAANPISATCTSTPEERYNYAYYMILNRWFNGDVEYMENNEWHDNGDFFNVVFPNGTSYETYYLTRRGGESNINVIAPWPYESVNCWWPYIPQQ